MFNVNNHIMEKLIEGSARITANIMIGKKRNVSWGIKYD